MLIGMREFIKDDNKSVIRATVGQFLSNIYIKRGGPRNIIDDFYLMFFFIQLSFDSFEIVIFNDVIYIRYFYGNSQKRKFMKKLLVFYILFVCTIKLGLCIAEIHWFPFSTNILFTNHVADLALYENKCHV